MRDDVLAAEKLKPDCSACCGLCCIEPAFDAAQGFGFDKPAHQPCLHLQADHRCAIHDHLAAKGFPGCVTYDCYGAGQRVTQKLFGGASWRKSPEDAARMFEAFRAMRALHELLAMLAYAQSNAAAGSAPATARALFEEIDAICEGGDFGVVNIAALQSRVRALAQALLRPRRP